MWLDLGRKHQSVVSSSAEQLQNCSKERRKALTSDTNQYWLSSVNDSDSDSDSIHHDNMDSEQQDTTWQNLTPLPSGPLGDEAIGRTLPPQVNIDYDVDLQEKLPLPLVNDLYK